MDESARMSESGCWGRPREPPREAQPHSLSLHNREPAVSMGTAAGSARPEVAFPARAQFPIRQEPGGTCSGEQAIGRGARGRQRGRQPRQIQIGTAGDPHRHRPDCAGHYDWSSLSIGVAGLSATRTSIGSISKASSLNWPSQGPSLIGQIRLSSLGLMALSDSLEPKTACRDEDRI